MTQDPYDALAASLGIARRELIDACARSGSQVIIKEAERGDGRKLHYGAGKQPIDTIMELGMGPGFCAGNVLKYLRRSKAPEHSTESARVYFRWSKELAEADAGLRKRGNWQPAMGLEFHRRLVMELTVSEFAMVIEGDRK